MSTAPDASDASQGHRVRPVRALFALAARAAPQVQPALEKLAWRAVYEVASLGSRSSQAPLNYGYADLSEESARSGENIYGLQLYEKVAGAIDLAGLEVLEVGSGRGVGAAHVFERFRPRSLTGLDLAASATRRATRRYGRPGLSFVAGDAEQLPFSSGSFDAVLNVESSHCYPNPLRFLEEVARVLRPGGHLLIADLRHTTPHAADDNKSVESLHREIEQVGLLTIEEEDITANVTHALHLDSPRRRARVERTMPRFARPHVLALMAVEGTGVYEEFASGRLSYLRLVLRKP